MTQLQPLTKNVVNIHTKDRVQCHIENEWQNGEGRTFYNLRAIEGRPFLVDSQLRHHMGKVFDSPILLAVTANRLNYGWILEN